MRVFNFGAGPAALPTSVLEQVQTELLDWNGYGLSVTEIGHRTPEFMRLMEENEALLRKILNIPQHYHVIFITSATRAHFAMIPMNFMSSRKQADYLNTGIWSHAASEEAKYYGAVNVAVDASASNFKTIPDPSTWQLNPDADYVHFTSNETINGLEFKTLPPIKNNVPLMVDMTSNILSKPIRVEDYAFIYAGAQKNISPAGLTIVIMHQDLMARSRQSNAPRVFNYANLAENHSLYYTPNTFSCYVANLVFKWIEQQGGLSAIEKINAKKSEKLYQAIDHSGGFYINDVDVNYRSQMNIPFSLAKPDLENVFLIKAKESGLLQLKGHKTVGGLRASLYNAVTEEAVDTLINFMQDFQSRYG